MNGHVAAGRQVSTKCMCQCMVPGVPHAYHGRASGGGPISLQGGQAHGRPASGARGEGRHGAISQVLRKRRQAGQLASWSRARVGANSSAGNGGGHSSSSSITSRGVACRSCVPAAAAEAAAPVDAALLCRSRTQRQLSAGIRATPWALACLASPAGLWGHNKGVQAVLQSILVGPAVSVCLLFRYGWPAAAAPAVHKDAESQACWVQ